MNLWSLIVSIGRRIRAHPWVTAAAAVVAGIAAALGQRVRHRREGRVVLPAPGALAAETAVSVHNAAKAAVITTAREAAVPDEAAVLTQVRAAVREAASSGADVTAVAIGTVEGAADVARLLGVEARALAHRAAVAATEEADAVGNVAGERVRGVLVAHL